MAEQGNAEASMQKYFAIKKVIAALEKEAATHREELIQRLGQEALVPVVGQAWSFPGLGEVAVVKGRSSEKLDRAALARRGVDPAVLDACTVKTEGEPTVRITLE